MSVRPAKSLNLISDIADFDRALRWISEDGQGEYTGWEIPAGTDAGDVHARCITELLDQCGTDEDRNGILAGTVEVTPVAA